MQLGAAQHEVAARITRLGAVQQGPDVLGGGVLDTATGVVIALIAALFARSVAIAEERFLEERFGAEYSAYRERVRHWI